MDLKEENAIGGDPAAHWYYIAKGRAIKQLLSGAPIGELLDVGAGSGVFSKMLVGDGLAARAVCVDPNYEEEFLGARRSDKIAYVRAVETVDADTIMMIDVIEHVDDDVGLMRHYAEKAPAGARFLISVPAFQSLWSSHDEYLEHRRRYTLSGLQHAVRAAGLQPVTARYFFGVIFPAAAGLRVAERLFKRGAPPMKSQLKKAPSWLNSMLIALHDGERKLLFPINRLAGVTAFCLAEKPAALAPATNSA